MIWVRVMTGIAPITIVTFENLRERAQQIPLVHVYARQQVILDAGLRMRLDHTEQ